jgi:glyoxylase-like metal-dependent hydrolase (beta-lactamase superfamily II)
MKIVGFACGWLDTDLAGLVDGLTGQGRIPVPAFYVEHDGHQLVFDSGLHPDVRGDAAARIGWLADVFGCVLPAGAAIDERLRSIDVDPDTVDLLISSHLHFDHAGGNELIPEARHLVQRAEWEAALAGDGAYDTKDFDLGHDTVLVDGEHDLFGDGRAVLLPTCGHTAGHQSLQLRTDDGRTLILCGDACYLRYALSEDRLPPFVWDDDLQLRSYEQFRRLERAGAHLVFGHDPDQWSGGATADVAASVTTLAG